MKKTCLCEWCIQGLQSHGEKIYIGDYINERCRDCGEDEDVRECVEE